MSPDLAFLNCISGCSANAEGLCDLVCGQPLLKKHSLGGKDFFSVQSYRSFQGDGIFRALVMRVRTSKNNLPNGIIANREHFHKLANLFSFSVQCNNFFNLSFAQLCAWRIAATKSWFKPCVVSMFDVFRACDPLKVFDSIIGFNPIEVINLVFVRWSFPQKSKSDERVQSFSDGFVPWLRKYHSLVATAYGNWNQDSVLCAFGRTSQPHDPANRTYGVKAFPPWNFAPFFGHDSLLSILATVYPQSTEYAP